MNRRLFSLGLGCLHLFTVSNAEARNRSSSGSSKRNGGGSSGGSRGGAGFRKANGKCADRNGR